MSSKYRSLADVRKQLKVNWYRSPVDPAVLRELTKRSDLQGWLQALGHFVLFLCTGTATFWMWSRQIWIGFGVGLFFHGTVTSFFSGTAPHELAHGTVFRTKWLNKAFMYLFSLISWWDPFDYAMSHTYHHRYTLHPEGDQEVLLPIKPTVGPAFLLQMFTVNLITRPGRSFGKGGLIPTILYSVRVAFRVRDRSLLPSRKWLQALHEDQPREAEKSVWWTRLLLLFHGSVLTFSILSGYWVVSILISVAPFTAKWAGYFVGLPQHCGMRDDVADFRKCARSFTLGPVLGFLYWRMNWHAEHHMYAAVPCYNLKKLARAIADDMPTPKTLAGAWREMRETWKRQLIDPDYQHDTPLPPTAAPEGGGDGVSKRQGVSDELERSIGELAPQGL